MFQTNKATQSRCSEMSPSLFLCVDTYVSEDNTASILRVEGL
jgi:hypothetical protein